MHYDVICHVTSQQCTVVDWPTVCSVTRLAKSCKIIVQQSQVRNINLNRVLGNNNYILYSSSSIHEQPMLYTWIWFFYCHLQ